MKSILIFLIFIQGSSFSNDSRIEKNKFDQVELGKTSFKEVKKLYPNSSIKKFKRRPLFRTENGRICIPITMEIVSVNKSGVDFYFDYYSAESEDSVFVYEIEFNHPFKGKTEKGISIKSSKQKVLAAYGNDNDESSKGNKIDYDWIEFRFDKHDKVDKIILKYIEEE